LWALWRRGVKRSVNQLAQIFFWGKNFRIDLFE
jgi:hypothetical protein